MSVVHRPGPIAKWYLPGIMAGLTVTIKNLLKNLFNPSQMQCFNYPEEKYEYSALFKGTHVLTVKKDGIVRCTACMLCATNCPADCISIITAESPDPTIEKCPLSYEIDYLRCVFCGYCEEACPVDAIRMGPEWQIPGINGVNFVKGIDFLAYRPQLKGGIVSVVDEEQKREEGI